MEKQDFSTALATLRTNSAKRGFSQTVDLIINLKKVNLKKPEDQVDLYVPCPAGLGKKKKICALVGTELLDSAKAACDEVIHQDQFDTYAKDKRKTKKLGHRHDYFVAQANIMTEIAKSLGRVLGPLGKMPNPKAGCVVPPGANLKQLVERLQRLLKVQAKTQPVVKVAIGSESMPDSEIVENMFMVYSQVKAKLSQGDNNIKNILIKLTMSKPIAVGTKRETESTKKK